MLYYADRRYTIIKNKNELYDIYDGKKKGNGSIRNQTKEYVDSFIPTRKNRPNADFLDREVSKQVFSYANISPRHSVNLERASLVTRLLEIEDFSRYKHPWLAKVIQLSMEYLLLEGLDDAFRSSQIREEILNICEDKLNT